MTTIVVDEVTKEWVVTDLHLTEEELMGLYAELESDCGE